MKNHQFGFLPAYICLLILARAAAAAAAAAAVAPILPPAAAAAALERSVNSSSCGYSGKPPCSVNCSKTRTELQGRECRRHEGTQQLAGSHNVSRSSSSSIGRLEPSGCRKGLTHVTFTPDLGLMPDLCLPLPKVGSQCGQQGQACCLVPVAGADPWSNIRAKCNTGLTCIVKNTNSLPYGSSRHAQTMLAAATNSSLAAVLRLTHTMGVCKQLPAALSVPEDAAVLTQQQSGRLEEVSADADMLFMPCGYTRACGAGSWCAGNEDHYLGGTRCLPLPPCGGANQPCCPPNAHGSTQEAHASILDNSTPMPYCTDADSTCLWRPDLTDLSQLPAQNDLRLRPAQASYSMSVTFPGAMCVPGLRRCGQKGKPCCPHAQYAVSNTKMYFRSHVCDAGLSCDATIDFSGDAPVLGICRGVPKQCGRVGQACCRHTDAAGWSWKTCDDGQPGVYCSRVTDVCKRCPGSSSKEMSPALAAEVGDAC